ncbi:MAG: energy-coupling factor transporter transmembrane protein EcfT [Chloroflexi bacterium]|nr:energy-coupling factor transporter transmembrane protein EcfT [Chloroflexota bacterium]
MGLLKFQTVERDSVFTRLDFRSKMVLMGALTVIAFLWESPLLGGCLAASVVFACLLAGVKIAFIRRVLQTLAPFCVLILLMHGFFNTTQVKRLLGTAQLTRLVTFPQSWWLIGGGGLNLEGLLYGLNVVFKTVSLMLVIPLGVFTTDVDSMVAGMVRARIPYKLAFVFSTTLRFVPLLFAELQSVIEAQRLRGLAFEEMGPLRRLRVYARIAIPLILGALVKSQQLEIVLQSKAFSGSPRRTYLHEQTMGWIDYAAVGLFAAFVVLVLVAYVVWGVGRFGGPI